MKKNATIGEKYGPAMQIVSPEDAALYFEQLVQNTMSFGKTREEAESIERQNLGYYAGYYGHDTRIRVEALFGCRHPIFGAATAGPPTAEEAVSAGRKMGEGKCNDSTK